MYQDNIVLCGASAYEQKYYFNEDFSSLPDHVKKELQIMCVLFTEEIGGIFTLEFDQNGDLQFKTEALTDDMTISAVRCGSSSSVSRKVNFWNHWNYITGSFSWEKIRLALRSRLHGAPLENRQC